MCALPGSGERTPSMSARDAPLPHDVRIRRRLGQPAPALGAPGGGHRLDRHLVLLHRPRPHAAAPRRRAGGPHRHRVGGARRRLLPGGEVRGGAPGAAGAPHVVPVGGVSHLADRLRAAGGAVLLRRLDVAHRPRGDAARYLGGHRDLRRESRGRLGRLHRALPFEGRRECRRAGERGLRPVRRRDLGLHAGVLRSGRAGPLRRADRDDHGVQRLHGDHPQPEEGGGGAPRGRGAGPGPGGGGQAAIVAQHLPHPAGPAADGERALPDAHRAPARVAAGGADHRGRRLRAALPRPRRGQGSRSPRSPGPCR